MINNVVSTFTELCYILSFRFDAMLRRASGTMVIGEYTMVIFRVRYEKIIESGVILRQQKELNVILLPLQFCDISFHIF